MSEAPRYTIFFTPAARRRLDKLLLPAAVALYEHLTGPVAENPNRLGKPLDVPFDDVWTTRRGDYRALYIIKMSNTVTKYMLLPGGPNVSAPEHGDTHGRRSRTHHRVGTSPPCRFPMTLISMTGVRGSPGQ